MKYLIKNNSNFKVEVNIKGKKEFLKAQESKIVDCDLSDIEILFKEFIIVSPYEEQPKKVEKVKEEQKQEVEEKTDKEFKEKSNKESNEESKEENKEGKKDNESKKTSKRRKTSKKD